MTRRGNSSSEVLEFLANLPLFCKVNESSIGLLASACRFRRVDKGEILFFHTDPPESAYVVRSGSVSMVLSSPDGREMVIREVREGEIFGELGVITRKARSTSAVARSDCDLLVIPAEAFLRVMDEEPHLARLILEITAARLQLSAKREMALAFMNAQSRLARILLALKDEYPEKGYVTVSQEDLARDTGLIRQTVAKALGKWRRHGWLLTGRGRIVILNRKALEEVEMGLRG